MIYIFGMQNLTKTSITITNDDLVFLKSESINLSGLVRNILKQKRELAISTKTQPTPENHKSRFESPP
jgi:hypothetical protein